MKAVQILEHGNLDVLKINDIKIPKCLSNKILINIKASAINHLDIWVRNGLPGLPIPLPLIMGSDGAGTIVEIGSNITDFNVGDNVVIQPGTFNSTSSNMSENYLNSYGILGETSDGTQAEYILLSKNNIHLMSSHLSFEEAASMQLVFMTSYQMIVERAKLLKDETILIYGATSGVGSAAIQIAKDIGAKVISTVGNHSKEKYAYDMGSDYVFIHDDDLNNNINSVVGKNPVNVVFEHTGLKTWKNSLRVLAKGGRIVTCGSTTGAIVEIDLRHLFMKQQTILGSTMASIKSFNAVMKKINSQKYTPFIDKIFDLKEVKHAHSRMENRDHFGKIVLSHI